MLTMKDLLMTGNIDDIPIEHQWNLEDLLKRVNIVLEDYGKSVILTSVYRSLQHHKDIYRSKGIPDNKIPMRSKHLTGNALDISDSKGEFHAFLRSDLGVKALDKADLWCETRQGNWQHLQNKSFGSYKSGGTRWFNP